MKNGWHPEQTSTLRSFLVERVWNEFPHAQATVTSKYSGWIFGFMTNLIGPGEDTEGGNRSL